MKKCITNIKYSAWSLWNKLNRDVQASGTLEMVLIIVVVLGILVIFRDNIEQLIKTIFTKINNQVNSF